MSDAVLGVNVAVVDGSRLLLLQREDFEVWCLPGGEVDPGESLVGAALREVREETGLSVALDGVIGTYSAPHWHGGIHIVLFAAAPEGGSLRADPEEAVDIGWFGFDELPVPLLAGQHQRIVDAIAGRCGVARTSLRRSPFASRAEAYRSRDASGLARADFYETFASAEEEIEGLV